MMRVFVFGRLLWVRAAVVAVSAFAVWATWLAVGGTSPAQATTRLATFNAHGQYTWTVPTGVTKITFTVYGASGGNVVNGVILLDLGGAGGEAKGTYIVKPGEVFDILVGGRGADNNGTAGGAGGFNGGGNGGAAESGGSLGGAGGGGGSDVRIGVPGYNCDVACRAYDRFIVGGGGGGASQYGDGGAGGGSFGTPGSGGASNGGQDGPFCEARQFTSEGCFGQGGDANLSDGGGGGGWFGGAGAESPGGGGGGGSGFVSLVAPKGSFPGGTHGGDGLIIITTP